MNLHRQIMNLPCDDQKDGIELKDTLLAYRQGHRDARQAAADLANDADAVIAEAKKIIEELCACYGHPLPEATLKRMA